MQQLIDVRVLAFEVIKNENLLEVLAISVAQVGVFASAASAFACGETSFTGASDKNGSFLVFGLDRPLFRRSLKA